MCMCTCIYKTSLHEQHARKRSVFHWNLTGLKFNRFEIGVFLIFDLVSIPSLKTSVYATIYTELERELLYSYVSYRYLRYVKGKQLSPGFELGSSCSFFKTKCLCIYVCIYVCACARLCVRALVRAFMFLFLRMQSIIYIYIYIYNVRHMCQNVSTFL